MTSPTRTLFRSYIIEEYHLTEEPYYVPVGDEIELFEAAYAQKIPVIFKGPTGCGKTRFVEYMSYRLGQPLTRVQQNNGAPPENGSAEADDRDHLPLVTIACHEDLTASDLVGRYLLEGDRTVWIDGPLTRAVKVGGICYLDEIVEARKDTTVLIHPLTDHRRILPVEKRGELLEAADGFLLILSYNPGYQSALKDLKHSTRQRFISIEFDYPPRDIEAEIIAHESGLRRRHRHAARQTRREDSQPQGAWAGRGRKHPPAHIRRTDDLQRHRPPPRLSGGSQLGGHGRLQHPAEHRRADHLHIRIAHSAGNRPESGEARFGR